MGEFLMPSLGADMDRGTLVEWLVRPGDEVHRGDRVAVVDTAKAAIEIEVFEDGRVQELLVGTGETVDVGTPLARLAAPGAAAPVPPRTAAAPALRARAAVPAAGPAAGVAAGPAAGTRRWASPLARRRAAELGVDLARLHGSGRSGEVRVADVEAAAAPPRPPAVAAPPSAVAAPPPAVAAPAAAGGSPADKASAMRAAIATLMARSKREIPHYYLQSTVDLAPALRWMAARNADRDVSQRLLPAALLLKAAAVAVHAVPELNGFVVDGSFRPSERVHLGVAVSLRGGGLVAPAIHDADRLGVDDIMAALKDLVARTRAGRLRGSEMADPTITVTSLGDRGAELVHGVIYPPQVALVGFGRIVERPWAIDGMLAVRPVVTVTLAADHRVTDGHRGGLYLAAVEAALAAPEEL